MMAGTQKVLKTVKIFQRVVVFIAILVAIGIAVYSAITLTARIAAENNPMYEMLHNDIEEARKEIEAANEAEKSTKPDGEGKNPPDSEGNTPFQ
jgi:DNA replication initiation complex subunit (GINS family)